jgi:hypothetical protein
VLVASSRRARRELGWHPQHSKLDEMLGDAWAWRLAHPDGYPRSGASSAARRIGQNGDAADAGTSAEQSTRSEAPAGTGLGMPLSEQPSLS